MSRLVAQQFNYWQGHMLALVVYQPSLCITRSSGSSKAITTLAWYTDHMDNISSPIDDIILQSLDVLHLIEDIRASYKSVSQIWKVCSRVLTEDVLDTYI